MATLDVIISRLRAALERVEQAEGELSPELESELDTVAHSLNLKAEAYAVVCRELESEADACDALAATYRDTSASKRARAGYLKARLRAALELAGCERATGATGGAALRYGTPAVEFTVPESEIPDEFCERKHVRLISRARIAEALKAGRELPFARLKQSRYLQWVR